jgi:hypothetical protein
MDYDPIFPEWKAVVDWHEDLNGARCERCVPLNIAVTRDLDKDIDDYDI